MKALTTQQFEEIRERESDVPVINVLSEDSYADAHIPETSNLPSDDDDFVERVEELAGSRSEPVILYCASSECDKSVKAAKKLEEAGFTNVYDYEEGTAGWKSAGREVATGAEV